MTKPCSIYLIGTEPGTKKIGVTHDVYRRLGQIQTGNPEKLEVFFTHRVSSSSEARAIESAAHRELARFRLKGEWFDITADLGKRIILEAANPALKQAATDAEKAARKIVLVEMIARNNEESQALRAEMTKVRTYLDELSSHYQANLLEWGNLTDELKMLG